MPARFPVADVIAGESAGEHVDELKFPVPNFSDIPMSFHPRPVPGQHPATIRIDFHLMATLEPRARESQRDAAAAGEQVREGHRPVVSILPFAS